MGHEINIDRIRNLEKEIEGGVGDIIELKRARNSLLNISVIIPPEILGSIFCWNVTPDGGLPRIGGFRKGTHNFLLVCHYWFEVASHTLELWGYWGHAKDVAVTTQIFRDYPRRPRVERASHVRLGDSFRRTTTKCTPGPCCIRWHTVYSSPE